MTTFRRLTPNQEVFIEFLKVTYEIRLLLPALQAQIPPTVATKKLL